MVCRPDAVMLETGFSPPCLLDDEKKTTTTKKDDDDEEDENDADLTMMMIIMLYIHTVMYAIFYNSLCKHVQRKKKYFLGFSISLFLSLSSNKTHGFFIFSVKSNIRLSIACANINTLFHIGT